MTWLRRLLLAGLMAWLAVAGAAWAAEAPPTDEAQGQVLVLLRLPPEHFRPGTAYAGAYGDGATRAARMRIASRIARAHGLRMVTDWPMPLVGLDCFVMRVPDGQSAAAVAEALSRDRAVAWAEPMQVYRALGASGPPNDPLFRLQPAASEWRLAELRGVATGRDVRVAVIDSAIDAAHPDLAGQLVARQDFVTAHPAAAELHGTAVAGVIGAVADNQLGVAGVAPGARLMALRACWQTGAEATVCDTLSLAKALHFAIDGRAQVINLSLGGPPNVLLGRLIDVALARGVVVVGAVDPGLVGGGFPASHRGVVAVAAEGGGPGTYAAPGRDVPTTQPGARFGLVNGSSYSAAHVSGLFALLRERGRPPLRLVSTRGGAIDPCASLRACALAAPLAARTLPAR